MHSVFALIEQMSERPEMYVGQRSVSCLAAYLDGWCTGVDSMSDGDEFNSFVESIREKFRISGTQSWDRILLFHSQDEAAAFDLFFRLFTEYRGDLER